MKKLKRGACAVLTLALAASLLAGCGSKTEEAEQPGKTGGKGGSANSGNTSQAEFIYVPEYIPIEGDFSDTLYNPTYRNGYIYAQGGERYWVDFDYSEWELPDGEIGLFSEDADMAEAIDEVPEPEAAPDAEEPDTDGGDEEHIEGENGYWAYRTVFYKIGLDGKSTPIRYEVEEDTEHENTERDSYGSNVQNILVSGDGSIYVIENTWHNWNDAPETVEMYSDEYWNYSHYDQSYCVRRIDESGTVLDTIDLSALKPEDEESYFYINCMELDDKGNIYVGFDQTIFILDAEGNLKHTIEGESYVQSLFRMPDGTVASYTYNWSGERGVQELCVIDPDTGKLGEGVAVSDFYSAVPGGGDYDFYFTSGINFYGYKLETGEREKLVNWMSSDVDPGNIRAAFALDDGRIVGLSSRYVNNAAGRSTVYASYIDAQSVENELVILTKTPADQVPQKQVLTLATQYLDYNVRGSIIDFNKSNDKYRIEVNDYSEYNTEDDYEAGLTKLRTEILSGTVPDMIDLNGLQQGQLATKGYLEDLYPFIDSDPELSREDLVSSVLRAFETDGKLYRTLSSFQVMTCLGAPEMVGDKPGWTVDEFSAALKKLREMNPEATAFDKTVTRDDYFRIMFYLDEDQFVNWSTGETHFDSEGFVKLLEFANTFPTEFDWENYEWTEEDDEYFRVSHGLQLLAPMSLYGFEVYQLRIYNKLFGGNAVAVGFPTSYGVGNVLMSDGSSLAMTSKCSDKDAAWQFLRQFFTEKYQTGGNVWGFPTNLKAFNSLKQQAMEPQYETDMNGNFVLDEKGNKIEVEYGTWGYGDTEVPGGPLTAAEAQQIEDIIATCTKTMNMDDTMFEIIADSAAPFFEGQRSAEDVAKQIQSKAMIYVNEQR